MDRFFSGFEVAADDQICANCKFWGKGQYRSVQSGGQPFYPCRYSEMTYGPDPFAAYMEAGASIMLLGADGHCREYGECFQPSEAFLRELEEREDILATKNRQLDHDLAMGW